MSWSQGQGQGLIVCRLCAIAEELPSSFTSVEHHDVDHQPEETAFLTLRDIIQRLFNIELIKEEIGTPICWKCFQLTNEFYSFLCTVKKGQEILKGMKEMPFEISIKAEETDFKQSLDDEVSNGPSRDDISNCDKNDIKDEKEAGKKTEDDDFFEYPKMYEDSKLILSEGELQSLLKKFYKFKCQICGEDCPHFFGLYQHYEKSHGINGFVSCCGRKMAAKRTIINHMGQHIQPSAFECPVCKKSLYNPKAMKIHLKIHASDDEKPFKCDQCGKRYIAEQHLKVHLETHTPLEERKFIYSCKLCPKTFNLKFKYSCHMSMGHKVKDKICSECGKVFAHLGQLKMHMSTHDKDGSFQATCEICGRILKSAHILKKHMEIHSDVLLECKLCDYKTHRKGCLSNHMRIKHSNDKPFECPECKKCFKKKEFLRNHMVQHTGEKKYSCPFCPRTFASSGNFYTHKKRMHSGEQKNNRESNNIQT